MAENMTLPDPISISILNVFYALWNFDESRVHLIERASAGYRTLNPCLYFIIKWIYLNVTFVLLFDIEFDALGQRQGAAVAQEGSVFERTK